MKIGLAIKEEIDAVSTDYKMICVEIYWVNCFSDGWLLCNQICFHDANVVSIFPKDADHRILKGIVRAVCFTLGIFRTCVSNGNYCFCGCIEATALLSCRDVCFHLWWLWNLAHSPRCTWSRKHSCCVYMEIVLRIMYQKLHWNAHLLTHGSM